MSLFDRNRVTIRKSAFENIIEVSSSFPRALSVFEWYRLRDFESSNGFLWVQRIKSDGRTLLDVAK